MYFVYMVELVFSLEFFNMHVIIEKHKFIFRRDTSFHLVQHIYLKFDFPFFFLLMNANSWTYSTIHSMLRSKIRRNEHVNIIYFVESCIFKHINAFKFLKQIVKCKILSFISKYIKMGSRVSST